MTTKDSSPASSQPRKEVLRPLDDEARRLARGLIRSARFGSLAALEPGTGHPLASRVALAPDMDGTPFILISALSGHTSALTADARCSLLLGEPGKGDPLAHPRVTLMCHAEKVERGAPAHDRMRQRYLARHPKAERYVDFADFSFFALRLERASLNGGFGKAFVLNRGDLLLEQALCTEFSLREAGVISHMNADHADALALYAEVLAKAGKGNWRLASIDPEGIDLRAGDDMARVWFPLPLSSPDQLRTALVELAAAARHSSFQD
ncbi:HugZ family protein [Roseibium litorale]|uniref:HugZ family protein n=1 Tax=Roseibium litorale TaxID=2803841 RepID=A0ABR9CIE2_9HYPH|nr:DUF2470 domain-containing protein [Roseibium litorale]MBD8890601.1 HugZ family protein [Roseibium litorale]